MVTVAGTSRALPGTDAGAVKVTPFAEYPGKGRATGGVRCHRFLKGEDVLLLAWAGPAPAWAAAASGAPVDLPAPDRRRDGSGVAGRPADRRGLLEPAADPRAGQRVAHHDVAEPLLVRAEAPAQFADLLTATTTTGHTFDPRRVRRGRPRRRGHGDAAWTPGSSRWR